MCTKVVHGDVQVLLPVLGNKNNHGLWPKVVSDDVLKHVYLLKNRVHVLSGQVKGKTLLPLPASAEFNRCVAVGDRYTSSRCFCPPITDQFSKGKKERKSIYIAPFCAKVHTKRSGMDHTVLPASNTITPCLPFLRGIHQMSPPQQLRQQTSNCSSTRNHSTAIS